MTARNKQGIATLGTKATGVLRQEGIGSAAKWGLRYLGSKFGLDPVYRSTLDSSVTLEVGDQSINIDREHLSLFYDVTDDFQSERAVVSDLLASVSDRDVVYDIGANVGLYTCFVGCTTDADVVAIEPDPINQEHLKQTLDLNDVSARVLPVAASDENGETNLIRDGRTQSYLDDFNEGGMTVQTRRGDSFPNSESVSTPTVMKIDVEGAELEVLRGFIDTLQSGDVRLIYCEVHQNKLREFGGSEDQLKSLLRECGFSLSVVKSRRSQYYLRAER